MIRKLPNQLINQTILFILGASSLFFIINLQSVQKEKITQNTLTKETYLEIADSEALRLSFAKKMPTFGFDNLAASWSMLQFLQYFGDDKARDYTGYSLSDDYLEAIAENDPRFSLAYLIISPASSLYGGTPQRTIELMNEGLEHLTPDMPKAYFVWLYKGMDEILFLGDLEKAKKSYQKAAEWAAIAGDERIAEAASDTVEFLETNPDTTEAQINAWSLLLFNSEEKATREIAKANIEKLGGEVRVSSDGRVEVIPPKANES